MLHIRNLVCRSPAPALASCSPSDRDYTDALQAYWPKEQVNARDGAAFQIRQAAAFEAGAHQARVEIAVASSLVSMRHVRCSSAGPRPGKNSEMVVTMKLANGRTAEIVGIWRFDRVGDQLNLLSRAV